MTAPFSDADAELRRRIADLERQVQSVTAENARLANEVQQRSSDLTEALTYQTGSANILKVIASSPTDVGPVLKAIADNACELCEAHDALVHLREGNHLRYRAHHGPIPFGFAKLPSGSEPTPFGSEKLPINRNWVTGRSVVDKVPFHVHDVLSADGADFPEAQRLSSREGTRTILSVPLLRDNESIGAIVLRRTEVNPFSEKQIALLQTFADQAVIAIENARLFEEVRARTHELAESLEQQTATSEVLSVISRSAGDLAPVFDAMLGKAMQLCSASFGVLNTYDGTQFHTAAAYGLPPAYAEFRRGRPLEYGPLTAPARLLRGEAFVEVCDLLESEAYRNGEPNRRALVDLGGARCLLTVPLLKDERVVGNVMIFRQENLHFSEKQIALLQQFAAQAVIAIENTRLLSELRRRTEDLSEALQQQTATADVLKVISRSAFDLQTVLETLIKSAVQLSGANRGSIFLREGDVFPLKAASSTTPEFLQYWAANPPRAGRGSATSRVIASGKVEIIPDVLDDPEMQMTAGSLVRIRAALGVPMLRDNKVEGVLVLTRPEPGPFTKSQIDLVQTFADQAVIAVENVRLFDEVQAKTKDLAESLQQQTATADVLKVISRSAFDLQSVLDTLVASAGELCGADGGVIWLRKGDLFHAGAAAGFSPQELAFFRENPRSIHDKSLAPRVLRSRRTEHIPDRALDPEFAFPGMSGLPSSMLGVPLLRDDHIEGVFTLARKNVAPFTPRQIELVESFADQAVIAIGNVRLFEQVQQRTRELSKSLDDLRTAQDRLVQTEKLASLGQLTAGIAHEIKNPLNFVNNFAALSGELIDELNELLKTTEVAANIRDEVDELTGMLKDNLQKVVQHGKRADSIVKNMLMHSREGSGEHRPTDVNALVEESLNLAYHGARAEKPQFDVTLKREFDPEAGMVDAFPQEITRVLLNLIANGFYAAAKRKAGNGADKYEPALVARTRDAGADVEIRIRDNGTGIPPEVRDKMFNPFFTTKPAGEGTGLGLSMSHDIIVKQHGGTIEVETVPGEFTEFTIRLPRKGNFSEKARG